MTRQLPDQHSRPDLEFVGDAPAPGSSDKAYSPRAKKNFKSISDRVAQDVAEIKGEDS